VLFTVLFGVLVSGDMSSMSASSVAIDFVKVVIGGVIVGVVLSACASCWLKRTFNDPMVEITLTLALAYFSMLIAEGLFHVSGVIALVVSGLWMGSVGRTHISPEVAHFLHHFWELLAHIANTVIFFLVGLVVATQLGAVGVTELLLIAGIYLGIVVIRSIMFLTVRPFLALVGEPVTFADSVVLAWGGLRGAVSLALVLIVFQHPEVPLALRDQMLVISVGVVLLTILVNGTTIAAVLRKLGNDKPPLFERQAMAVAYCTVLDRVESGVAKLSDSEQLKSVRWAEVYRDLGLRQRSATRELEELTMELSNESELSGVASAWRQVLGIERAAYWEAFSQGVIGGAAVRALTASLEHQSDQIALGSLTPPERRAPARGKISARIGRAIRDSDFLRGFIGDWEFSRLAGRYDLTLGERFAAEKVLAQLEGLTGVPTAVRDEIIATYHRYQEESSLRLERLRTGLPEMVCEIETRLAHRMALNLERDVFKQLGKKGVLSETNTHSAVEEVEEHMAKVALSTLHLPFPSIEDLLQEVPLFSSCSEEQLKEIASQSSQLVLPAGDWLFHEGEKGDSMFIVVRGSLSVMLENGTGNQPLAVLGGGELIGEMALLTGEPRSASARAASTLALVRIKRASFETLTRQFPEFREDAWRAYAHHALDNYLKEHRGCIDGLPEEPVPWIHSGELFRFSSSEAINAVPGMQYGFLVDGVIQCNGSELCAPQVIEVTPELKLAGGREGRVLWLPAP